MLVSFVFLMCAGQILFKKTSNILKKNNSEFSFSNLVDSIFSLFFIPYFYIAMLTYGLATFFWLYILQKIPLSLAYPFTALAMIIIPVVSVFLFKEEVSTNYWIGASLIACGICIISLKI